MSVEGTGGTDHISLPPVSSAYVLFYHRRTEGRPTRAQLNRSLSVSFAEEVKKGQRFRPSTETPQLTESMEVDKEDSNKIAEENQKEVEVRERELCRGCVCTSCLFSSG